MPTNKIFVVPTNSIHLHKYYSFKNDQPKYPGNRELERKIKNIVLERYGYGRQSQPRRCRCRGTYFYFCIKATMLEVGFNHFFKAPTENSPGDLFFLKEYANPGIYALLF